MAKIKQAFRPNNLYSDFDRLKTFQENQELEKKGIDPDDNHLYALSKQAGWRILRGYIQSLIDDLDSMVIGAMAAGASLEDIGQRTMLATLTKEALKKVQHKVDDSSDAVQEANNDENEVQEM